MRPESTSNPAYAGCNSDRAQYSSTPSLRSPGFEDDDEDENEAPQEWRPKGGSGIRTLTRSVGQFSGAPSGHDSSNAYPGLKPSAMIYNRFAVKAASPYRRVAVSPIRRVAHSPFRRFAKPHQQVQFSRNNATFHVS
jgi:hypothetical protein